jgi:atypical dual specificity phosphatase
MDRQGFYWLIEGALAGCGRPGNWTRRDGDGADHAAATAALDEDLRWLRDSGIEAVLTLTETPLLPGALARHGLAELHLPVDDLTPPSPAQLDAAIDFIDAQRVAGKRVAVHCLVGQGRTGTVLAAYLIRGGLSAEAALRELRSVCPQAVGSASQEEALRSFARRKDWIV